MFYPYTEFSAPCVEHCSGIDHCHWKILYIDIQPGDQVYIKNWQTDPLREAWDGPHQVILTTFTAVKVAGIDSWIHYTRVKKVPAQWETQVLSPTRMIIRAKEPHC
uniref:Murine leukemia virus integrase C-terminal domain-containing protein n=1 Tax=Serinus canaria TaxID=9135 RepID=A0A8C9L6E1_SERCA